MNFNWPWNSLHKAYVSWQNLEHRRLAARQALERRYVDLLRVAESLDLDSDQGLLKAARLALGQPPDPVLLQTRDRLQKAFALLGKSLWRPVPTGLQTEFRRYASHIEALCRKYEELGAGLLSAQKFIEILPRDPASGGLQDFRLALVSPDAAWLIRQLREKGLAERQAREDCLALDRRIRMTTCQRWLVLLQDSLPASTFRQFDRSLKELAKKAVGEEKQEVPDMLADQAKLDLLSAVANRQATRAIADLLPRKNN